MRNRSRAVASLLVLVALGACREEVTFANCPDLAHVQTAVLADTVVLSSGLRYIEGKVGTGTTAEACRLVGVHYTGSLIDGTEFDSSRQRGPLSLVPGMATVIPGFEQGVIGMRVGGTRRLIIPPSLGYAASPPQGSGIPANATLIFDLELVGVR